MEEAAQPNLVSDPLINSFNHFISQNEAQMNEINQQGD